MSRNFRLLFLLVFLFGSTLLCQTDSSTIKIFSEILDEERTISVSLPEGYENSGEEYPVLYVLDAEGEKLFPESVATVKGLNSKGEAPQMIIVGIWNTQRNRDMIPEAVPHRPGSGGSENFLYFIKDELMPYIEQNYRVSDYSILYGMSNSALFCVYALLEKPEVFNAYIASSPMIGHCPDFIHRKSEAFIERGTLIGQSLYMIYGTKDTRRVTEYVPDFQNRLDWHGPKGFRSTLKILDGEGHVPESSLERGLRSIFASPRQQCL